MVRLDREEWKDIPGFEGVYQASTHGRIKRLKHWKNQNTERTDPYTKYRMLPEKIMSLNKSGGGLAYDSVCLSKDKKAKTYLVHRLVAQTFIPNPDNLPEINHKDCNGHNNHIDNLEWCDRTYNINYADRTLKAMKAIEKKTICIETGVIYESGTKAAKALGLQKSKISLCCNGKRKTTGGLHWRFA